MPCLAWVQHPRKRCMDRLRHELLSCSHCLPAATFSTGLFVQHAGGRLHSCLLLMLNEEPQGLISMLKISCKRRPAEDGCVASRCVSWGAQSIPPVISPTSPTAHAYTRGQHCPPFSGRASLSDVTQRATPCSALAREAPTLAATYATRLKRCMDRCSYSCQETLQNNANSICRRCLCSLIVFVERRQEQHFLTMSG